MTRIASACFVCLCALHGAVAFADSLVPEDRPAQDALVQRWLVGTIAGWLATYRQLHAHPELSLQERETAALVARELTRAGYRVTTGVGGYGVVGLLDNGAGPTVLLRGDMDALPVAEQTGLPYSSHVRAKNEQGTDGPVMHACGHDLHVVNLLAVAAFMAAERSQWSGKLLIVAQPAEEIGEGASMMIKAGLLQRFPRPDYAIALHVDDAIAAGHVGSVSGWAAANVDSVDVTLFGRGGHGARPSETVDPIVAAAHFVTALQTLVSRRNDPQQPAVVTVGSIHGGSKHNVIPDEVRMQLTVRSFSDPVRKLLLDGVAQLARDICTAFGCPKPPEVRVKESYTPAVYNDPQLEATARKVFVAIFGEASVEHPLATMGGEDFGRFPRALGVPGLLFRLGGVSEQARRAASQPGAAPLPSLHSSRFAPDAELALRTGVRATTGLLLALLPRAQTAAP